jgi:hypothetical protein
MIALIECVNGFLNAAPSIAVLSLGFYGSGYLGTLAAKKFLGQNGNAKELSSGVVTCKCHTPVSKKEPLN